MVEKSLPAGVCGGLRGAAHHHELETRPARLRLPPRRYEPALSRITEHGSWRLTRLAHPALSPTATDEAVANRELTDRPKDSWGIY